MHQIQHMIRALTLSTSAKWSWFYTPLLVLGLNWVIALGFAVLIPGNGPRVSGSAVSIYATLAVISALYLAIAHPFGLSFMITRRNIFLGHFALNLILAAALGLVMVLLGVVERLTGGFGVDLRMFNLPIVADLSPVQKFLVFSIPMLFLFALGSLFSAYLIRYRIPGMLFLLIGGILILGGLSLVISLQGWWANIWTWVMAQSAWDFILWLVPVCLVCWIATYLFLRRSEV